MINQLRFYHHLTIEIVLWEKMKVDAINIRFRKWIQSLGEYNDKFLSSEFFQIEKLFYCFIPLLPTDD